MAGTRVLETLPKGPRLMRVAHSALLGHRVSVNECRCGFCCV